MSKKQETPTEQLIAEPLCVRLDLYRSFALQRSSDQQLAPSRPHTPPLTPEAQRVVNLLKAAVVLTPDTIITWGGREHRLVPSHPVHPDKGTRVKTRSGAAYAVQIVIAPVDQPSQHIYMQFAVVAKGCAEPGDAPFFLECEGNPTTLMAGNNVLPVTARRPATKALERYHSSAHAVMTTFNHVLFRFLESLAAQVPRPPSTLFTDATRRAIEQGDITIAHIQWCCYLQAEPSVFLQTLVAMFAPPTATDVGFSSLAQQLGLRFKYETNERTSRVQAVLFEKRYGKNAAWAVAAYAKRAQIGSMRQGKTLDDVENELVDNYVRFDMTAHGPAIMKIIADGQNALRELRELDPEFLDKSFAAKFLSAESQQTARWLEFAVFILSHLVVKGAIRRRSFAGYVVPLFLNDVLGLAHLACCTLEQLTTFEELADPVAKAWRGSEAQDAKGWVERLCEAAGCGKTAVYARRASWLRDYDVDIAIPHAFYRDLRIYAPLSLLPPQQRDELLTQRQRRHGEDLLRLLDGADRNFFAQMNTVVGNAVRQPPVLLSAKIIREIKSVRSEDQTALSTTRATDAKTPAPPKPAVGWSISLQERIKRIQRAQFYPPGVGGRTSRRKLEEVADDLQRQLEEEVHPAKRKRLTTHLHTVCRLLHQTRERAKRRKFTRRFTKANARQKRDVARSLQISRAKTSHVPEKG